MKSSASSKTLRKNSRRRTHADSVLYIMMIELNRFAEGCSFVRFSWRRGPLQVSVLTFDTTRHKMSGKGNPSFGSSLVAMNWSAQVNLGLAG